MTRGNTRRANASKLLVGLLAALVAVPILVVVLSVLSYRTSQVTADDGRPALRVRAGSIKPVEIEPVEIEPQTLKTGASGLRASGTPPLPRSNPSDRQATVPRKWEDHATSNSTTTSARDVARPSPEVNYREERTEVWSPKVDPATGKVVMQRSEVIRRVPTSPSFSGFYVPQQFASRALQLANELRGMEEGDARRDAKLDELRKRLELEFAEMHDKQSIEIRRTEERLEALKKLHMERHRHRDKIVQRRIDELLGKTDALQWNPNAASPHIPQGGPATSNANAYAPFTPPRLPNATVVQPGLATGDPSAKFAAPSYGSAANTPPQSNATISSTPQFNGPELRTPQLGASQWNSQNSSSPQRTEPRLTEPRRNAPIDDYRRQPRGQATLEREESPAEDASPPSFSSRANVSTSTIGKLFDLARRTANANAEFAAAELEVSEARKLHDKGAMPVSEIRERELKLERLRREVQLNEVEFDALGESLNRELEFAKASHDRAVETMKMTRTRVQQGIASTDQLLNAEFEITKAKKSLDEAEAGVRQLTVAQELIAAPRAESEALDDAEGDAETETDVEVKVESEEEVVVDKFDEEE